METHAILVPAACLAIWTLLVLLLIPFQRFRAIFAGEAVENDFQFGESARVSERVIIPNRNYMNLLEAPILFYVACISAVVIDLHTALLLALCWAYVGLRIAHSLVHLSYNRVYHRLVFFALSNGVLAVTWILILLALI